MDPATVPAPSGLLLAASVAMLAAALWLLLPKSSDTLASRRLGILLGALALVGFAATGRSLGSVGENGVFLTVSAVALVSGLATVVTRSPVYAAIWFAMALAGVAGVLLTLGAQFLGVATIVVYAGAILVMFLFVLMLAQPSGMAPYDRVTNEPMLAASAGAVLLGLLSMSIGRLSAIEPPACCRMPSRADAIASGSAAPVSPEAGDEVARLGAELFGRHLFSVEVAGILLLVALVGAIAVVSRGEAAAEPGREAA
ncbi:MAG: NADH-quinone oxidoreductase subunit J [Planctomycetaceae bacterium]